MEYRNLDFDGDRVAQYTKLRSEMARKYMEEDVSLFGPVAACTLHICSHIIYTARYIKELDENEKEAYVKLQKEENEMRVILEYCRK